MSNVLSTALALHQAGRLNDAAPLYQSVLTGQPQNADAWHLFGLLHLESGRPAAAIELIGRAVALRPRAAAYHANLAEAHRALGDFDRAADCCRTALDLKPDYPEAYCNLGLCLQGLGRAEEAVEQFQHALRLRPEFATAHNNLGAALRDLECVDEALEEFRRAIECDAGLALAQSNLGQMLLDRGRPEEALPYCQEAVRLQAHLAPLRHNLGNALRALGRTDEAQAEYEQALRIDPSLSQTHAALGKILFDRGDEDAAIARLEQAVAMEPRNAVFWSTLGDMHAERNAGSEAIGCFERVLALEPDRLDAHNALGSALQLEGRHAEAREHFLTALRLHPEAALARINLGGLYEELGEMAEAEEWFRAALRLQPTLPGPQARLATLLRAKLPDADQAALEDRLADPDLAPEGRSNLLFGLAHVLDARGEYARAADCLKEANALALSRSVARHHDYVPDEHQRFVDALLAGCDTDFFQRLSGGGLQTRRPIFVFGLPRSGTTLIEQVLASHSGVKGAGELRLAWRSFTAMPEVLERSEPARACLAVLNQSALRRLAERHLESLSRYEDVAGDSIVDKMPDNYQYLGLLSMMFPNAAFIHCRRDLRDVAVSCWMTNFRTIRWANVFEHIATRFAQYLRLMKHWRAVLPVPVHEVQYEETVADLEGVARRLVAACGLEWEPACLEFHRNQRPIRTASVTQVRQPIYTRSLERWRNYEGALAELFAILPYQR